MQKEEINLFQNMFSMGVQEITQLRIYRIFIHDLGFVIKFFSAIHLRLSQSPHPYLAHHCLRPHPSHSPTFSASPSSQVTLKCLTLFPLSSKSPSQVEINITGDLSHFSFHILASFLNFLSLRFFVQFLEIPMPNNRILRSRRDPRGYE